MTPATTTAAYSAASLARRWGVSAHHIRKLCAAGDLQYFRLGSLIRIAAAEVARIEECGSSYTQAQGKPDMCPASDFSVPADLREEFLEKALGYILRQSMHDEGGNQVAGIAPALSAALEAKIVAANVTRNYRHTIGI